MKNRKLIGLMAFFTAIGMVIVIIISSRLAILMIIALLLLLGYCCFMD